MEGGGGFHPVKSGRAGDEAKKRESWHHWNFCRPQSKCLLAKYTLECVHFVVTFPFSKSFVFTFHITTSTRCFQIYPVWKAFSKGMGGGGGFMFMFGLLKAFMFGLLQGGH